MEQKRRGLFFNFQQLRQENVGIDVEIIVVERKFPAHRLVLMAGSGFFNKMFTSDMKEKHQKVITVGDESIFYASTFELILDCIYTGKLDLNENNAEDLVRAADFLDIQAIRSHVETFICNNIFAENVIKMLFFANKYNLANLHIVCSDYLFVPKNIPLVARTDQFVNMNYEDLLYVIEISEKHLQKLDIYKLIMIWIKHSPIEKHGYLFGLLSKLPLESLPKKFLKEFASQEALIHRTHKCAELLLNATASSKNFGETIYILTRDQPDKWMMFDVHKKKWIALPPMQSNRTDFLLHTVIDSKIFICGGKVFNTDKTEAKITNELEMFDTVCQEWKYLKPMKCKRVWHGLAAHEGKLYACGGSDGNILASMECYCPVTNCWKELAPMQVERFGFQLVELNGYLYAINGVKEDGLLMRTVERYDPRTDQWTMVAPTNFANGFFEAVVYKNMIFILNSDGMEAYDPIKNEWNRLQDPNIRSVHYRKLILFHDKLYHFVWKILESEEDDENEEFVYDNYKHCNAKVYVFEENGWSLIEDFPKTPAFWQGIAIVS